MTPGQISRTDPALEGFKKTIACREFQVYPALPEDLPSMLRVSLIAIRDFFEGTIGLVLLCLELSDHRLSRLLWLDLLP
jgi:hypothetical protein